MWTVPNNLDIYPSVPDMTVSDLDLSEQGSTLASQFMWRSKPSQPRTWSTRLKREPWVRAFITRTLKPSHSENFEDALISYLGGSPASPSAKPEKAKETKTPATSSPISSKGSESAGLVLSSSKTSKESCPPSSKERDGETPQEHPFCSMSLENWSAWVTEQRQSRRQRQKSVLLTKETDGSLSERGWMTPRAGNQSSTQTTSGRDQSKVTSLDAQVPYVEAKNWPTTCTRDHKGCGNAVDRKDGKSRLDSLEAVVKYGQPAPEKRNTDGSRRESLENIQWRTPSAMEAGARVETLFTKDGKPAKPGQSAYRLQPDGRLVLQSQTINQQVEMAESWPTVMVGEAHLTVGNQKVADARKSEGKMNLTRMASVGGKLNPRWVETLMGLPVGWTMPSCANPVTIVPTSCDCSEMVSCPSQPAKHSLEGCGTWATPNTMDHLAQRSPEALKRQSETTRKGRARPANLREQVNPKACAIYMNKKSLRLSASQIDTARTCLRAWWLGKIAKCPQPFDRKLLLGEVGHGVCENHLLSKPLYPDGWTSPINRFTGQASGHAISTTEQALVKALITKSIDEGVLVRHPDQFIEKEFKAKCGEIEGIKISLIGYIDHFYGNHIDDHKFTGAPRYYGVSKLSRATAMNLYAWAMYEEGLIKEDTAWLRYNLFVKDTSKPMVKPVSVEKSKEDIYSFYREEIEPSYRPMALAFKNCTEYHQVESAMDQGRAKQACDKYGGCPYLDICMGRVSVDSYKERFNKTNLDERKKSQSDILSKLTGTAQKEGEKKMPGFLSGLKQQDAGTSAPVEKETKPVEKEHVHNGAEAEIKQMDAAPWAFAACPVCKDTATPGIKDSKPCNICVVSTNAAKEQNPDQPVLDDYEVAVADNGTVTWTAKSGEVVTEAKPVEKEPEVKEQVESLGGDEFEEELSPAETSSEEASVPSSDPLIGSEPSPLVGVDKTFNQEKMGFSLSYSAVRSRKRQGRKMGEANTVMQADELLEVVKGGLLETANRCGAQAREWLDIDVFKRREIIQHNAKEIAELVRNSTLDASALVKGSDTDTLIRAIDRYAGFVFGEVGK